jgi:pSer/pThr/pTyr-binding forkhead associated (FHA) protein
MQGHSAPGREFSLNQEEIIIGRDPSTHLVTPSPAISRHHARLCVQGRQYLVEVLEQQ